MRFPSFLMIHIFVPILIIILFTPLTLAHKKQGSVGKTVLMKFWFKLLTILKS